jgi:glutamine amidotransferase
MGKSVPLENLLYKPQNSLIDQSMSSRSAETPTNADGFGVGWYSTRQVPGVYRSIRPAWNDMNLRELAYQIDAHLVLAHVRATSLATVQETNCHPFRFENWLFVHNGEVNGIELFRKRLIAAVDDDLFPNILGTTDSEVMFYVALTLGLESDPPGALARMAGFIEGAGRDAGIHESLWMTLGITDGQILHAVRYATDGQAPTLYHSLDADKVFRRFPDLKGKFSDDTRLIASEPAGRTMEIWAEIPQGTYVRVERGEMTIRPFKPEPPGAGPYRVPRPLAVPA